VFARLACCKVASSLMEGILRSGGRKPQISGINSTPSVSEMRQPGKTGRLFQDYNRLPEMSISTRYPLGHHISTRSPLGHRTETASGVSRPITRTTPHFTNGATRWHYGYDLSELTGLKSGTLYPILARLHEESWLQTRWVGVGESGRPPRHLCRLTPLGRAQAKQALQASTEKKQNLRPAYEI
jgi:PadR family transcriptional regulator, regulatory protein PadR